eukprot:UN06510
MKYRVADTGEQVLICHVEKGSEAAKADVEVGDVVTTVNGDFMNVQKMVKTLQSVKPPFEIQVSRLRQKSTGDDPREISALPSMNKQGGFLRVYLSEHEYFTVPCKYDTTVADVRKHIINDLKEKIPKDHSLFVCGWKDLRQFSNILDEVNNPLEIRDSISKDGQYSVKFIFKKPSEHEEDSDSDSDYSSDPDEVLPAAPTRALFRSGSADQWEQSKIDEQISEMAKALRKMKSIQTGEPIQSETDLEKTVNKERNVKGPGNQPGKTEGGEGTPMGESMPADPTIVAERIHLVEEAVRKEWFIAEALHDFDKNSIPNWPDYSTLQSLQQGDMLLVSKQDPTGWWKGKNIMGGDYESEDGAYFPGSYVEIVAKPLFLAKAQYAFDPSSVPNFPSNMLLLTLTEGDVLIITDTHESGWWRGCNLLGGAEGYFPKDFVEITAKPNENKDNWSSTLGKIHYAGWLDKKARVMRKWKPFYFVYSGDCLQYFENDN